MAYHTFIMPTYTPTTYYTAYYNESEVTFINLFPDYNTSFSRLLFSRNLAILRPTPYAPMPGPWNH